MSSSSNDQQQLQKKPPSSDDKDQPSTSSQQLQQQRNVNANKAQNPLPLPPSSSAILASRRPLIPADFKLIEDALARFVCVFEERYGVRHPRFHRTTLQQAAIDALGLPDNHSDDCRPLALYLHNDNSTAANNFAKEVICSPAVTNLLNSNFVIWPWDVTDPKNRQALLFWMDACQLHSVSQYIKMFPLNKESMLVVLFGRNHTFIERKKIVFEKDDFQAAQRKLMDGVEWQQTLKKRWAEEQRVRIEREKLRQKQADEYEKAKAADRVKLEELRKQRERKAEEERQRADDERKRQERRVELKKQLPSEPETTDPTVYTIRLRTPEETFLRDRLFRAREDVRLLSIYAAVNGYDEDRYGLWAYGTGEIKLSPSKKLTFDDLGWKPRRAIVYIQLKPRRESHTASDYSVYL